MTTATLEKRIRALEEQVRELKRAARPSSASFNTTKTIAGKQVKAKKLPAGLRQALREVAEGKLSGPFANGEELKAYFEG